MRLLSTFRVHRLLLVSALALSPSVWAAPPSKPPTQAPAPKRATPPRVARDAKGFDLVGGQGEAVRALRRAIEVPIKHPGAYEEIGTEPVRGVLMYGAPGNGKTLMARTVAESMGAKFFTVGAEDFTSYINGGPSKIKEVFDQAAKKPPAVIFIDEIDTIGGNRNKLGHEDGKGVAALLKAMDGVKQLKGVVVLGATNRPDELDPALRSRFEENVHVPPPDEAGRREILDIHTRTMPLDGVDIRAVAKQTNGFSGRDLASVVKKAGAAAIERQMGILEERDMPAVQAPITDAMRRKDLERGEKLGLHNPEAFSDAIERQRGKLVAKLGERAPSHEQISAAWGRLMQKPRKQWDHQAGSFGVRVRDGQAFAVMIDEGASEPYIEQPIELTEKPRLSVNKQDFAHALSQVKPSVVAEFSVETPSVHWDDIAGLDGPKEKLKDAVERPLSNPAGFKRLGIEAPKGVILYGPPGTGKTLLAKAVATEAHANFISVKGSDVMSMWVNQSSRMVKELFDRARAAAPVVLFLDEADAILPARLAHPAAGGQEDNKVVSEFLQQLEGIEQLKGVTVIAATNRPQAMAPAFLRPGRFDAPVYVPLPDDKARRQAFDIHTREMPLASNVNLATLTAKTRGYSGADIKAIAQKAGLAALRESPNAKEVTMEHFRAALAATRPSVTLEMKAAYDALAEKLGGGS
jgi:transitional endoplasmic reticulum ATPase